MFLFVKYLWNLRFLETTFKSLNFFLRIEPILFKLFTNINIFKKSKILMLRLPTNCF